MEAISACTSGREKQRAALTRAHWRSLLPSSGILTVLIRRLEFNMVPSICGGVQQHECLMWTISDVRQLTFEI